jgi:predicted ATPase
LPLTGLGECEPVAERFVGDVETRPPSWGSAFPAPEQSAPTQSVGVSRRRPASAEEDFLLVKRYILTGAPAAGKTSILRSLAERGWAVVEEAATAVIAREQLAGVNEPWQSGDFADKIVTLQRQREQQPVPNGVRVQFHDRSPLCTLALVRYLGHPVTTTLTQQIARVTREQVFERAVNEHLVNVASGGLLDLATSPMITVWGRSPSDNLIR